MALEVAAKMRPPATKIKALLSILLFSGQPLPQPQPGSTCKSLHQYGPSHLTWRLWILCESRSSVVGKSLCLFAFNTVNVIGAGVVLKLNDGSLRCLVRVRSRSQLAPGHSDHPWWSIGPPSQPAHWWWCCWWQWCFLSSHLTQCNLAMVWLINHSFALADDEHHVLSNKLNPVNRHHLCLCLDALPICCQFWFQISVQVRGSLRMVTQKRK